MYHLRLYAAQVQEALVAYYKGYRRHGIRFTPSAEAWHEFKVFMKIYIIAKYNCSETIDPILLGLIQLDAAYDCEIPCQIRPAAGSRNSGETNVPT